MYCQLGTLRINKPATHVVILNTSMLLFQFPTEMSIVSAYLVWISQGEININKTKK